MKRYFERLIYIKSSILGMIVFTVYTTLFSMPTLAADIAPLCSLEQGLKLEKLANKEYGLAEDSLTKEGAATELGTRYSENSILHFKQALDQYICASKSGDHQASLQAARLLGSGMVDPVPDNVVEQYLLDAANAEISDAQLVLSGHYCWGKFTGCKNRDKAWYWLNRAAKNNNTTALGYLAMAYEHGDSVPKNMGLAFKYYKRKADLGVQTAHQNACRLLKSGLYIDNTYLKTCK